MTLFLDGIFSSSSSIPPSAVVIRYPKVGAHIRQTLTGLLVSEPTVSSAISWGPILNDVSNLQDVASLLGSADMWTWIGASVMCWKGTSPIKTSIEFYLINYKRNLGLENGLKDLNYLTSLYDVGKKVAVEVHGGYKARVLETNRSQFDNGTPTKDILASVSSSLTGYGTSFEDGINMEEGTIAVSFGNKMTLRNMLIQRLDVTPSLVEVPDGKPLYYRVSMGLVGSRPLLSTDVDRMYDRSSILSVL